MRERPILFKGPLVRAILSGTKTVTRRIIKGPALDMLHPSMFTPEFVSDPANDWCPHGKVGDRLYVREAWRTGVALDDKSPSEIRRSCLDAGWSRAWAPLRYEADQRIDNADTLEKFGGSFGRYRQGMHILREFSRIDLDILSVRAERVQEITRAEVFAEGVDVPRMNGGHDLVSDVTVIDAFSRLWDSINGKRGPKGDPAAYSWERDPWVFRIEWPKYSAARAA